MTRRFWPIVCATGLTVSLIGTIANDGHAQRGAERGRRAAGSAGGGFSREGPAASGGLSSRSSGAPAQQTRARDTGENQAARQDSRAGAQASRQQSRSSAQSSRQEVYEDEHWDEGKGLAVAATGVLVAGTAAAAASAVAAPPPAAAVPSSQFATPAATPLPPAAAPCASPTSVPVGEVTYSKCGSTWYTQAYGANGLVYVQSAPPPGS